MKILELFGGIGACTKALKRIGQDIEVADYVEIDKYAVASYNAINNTSFEPQDICKWDKDIEVDLIMHGSPCQDFSLAGKQAGGDEGSGTRSSLMYETLRIVEKLKPKYVVWENVKNILSNKHFHNFDNYSDYMFELGYNSHWKVLNAKDYGIPQNRERVFTISIRKDILNDFNFPPKRPLELRLKDLLEDEVDEKYYISDKQIEKIKSSKFMQEKTRIQEKDVCDTLLARDYKDPKCVRIGGIFDTETSTHQAGSIWNKEGLSPTLDTMQGGYRQPHILIRNATKKGYSEAVEGDGIDVSSRMQYHRGTVQSGMVQTLDTQATKGVVVKDGVMNGLRIRKLTPKECWRLMGFDDEDFDKASKVNSNTQLYKQAGNSIVVNVLEEIFKNLIQGGSKLELKINEMQELKPIDFNFEEIKNELELKLKNYDTMIYSEDNIKAAKEDRATLNKLSKSLDTRRKEIKNEYMKPYAIFEEKMKILIGLVDNTSNKIDVQVKGYEDKIKQDKRVSIEKVYEDNIGELKGLVSFDKLFREKWLNVSEKLSKVSQELIDEITRIKNEYDGLQQVMSDKELEDMKVFFFSTLSLERTLYQKKILDEEKAKIKAAEQGVKPEVSKIEVKEVKLYEVKFKLTATAEQLDLLKQYLIKNNIKLERID